GAWPARAEAPPPPRRSSLTMPLTPVFRAVGVDYLQGRAARPPKKPVEPPHRGGEAGRVMVPLELAGVAARAHAGPVGIAVALVMLLVLIQAVERPGSGANQAADGRALAGALATIGDRSAAGAHRGTEQRAEARILDGVDLLVAASAL